MLPSLDPEPCSSVKCVQFKDFLISLWPLVRRKRCKGTGLRLLPGLSSPMPPPSLPTPSPRHLKQPFPGTWLHKSQVSGGLQPTITLGSYSPWTWTKNGSDSLLLIFRSVFEGQGRGLCPRLYGDRSPEFKACEPWHESTPLTHTKHEKL